MRNRDSSSFKDPDGYVFYRNDEAYRQVNESYKKHYKPLMSSGLYDELVNRKLLIPHRELDNREVSGSECFRIIKPTNLDFISYPYEWSFSQLKDAALLILEIQKTSLDYGMTLKDASPFNVQFKEGKPILIDTLSFKLESSKAWSAYEQFCKLFLMPLCLMAYKNPDMKDILKLNCNEIYAEVARTSMPLKSYLKPSIFLHVHMVSKISHYNSAGNGSHGKLKFSDRMKKSLNKHLRRVVKRIDQSYSGCQPLGRADSGSIKVKKELLSERISCDAEEINQIWAIIDTNRMFQYLSSQENTQSIILEKNSRKVEYMYRQVDHGKKVVPVQQAIRSPSPGLGWKNKEMKPMIDRGNPDLGVVFSQIRDLVLNEGVPLEEISEFLSNTFQTLIIEFNPIDSVEEEGTDRYENTGNPDYNKDKFESSLNQRYRIVRKEKVEDSGSIIYVLER